MTNFKAIDNALHEAIGGHLAQAPCEHVTCKEVNTLIAERDRLREEKRELANALIAASYALRQVIAQFSSEKNKINASVLPDSIDALVARVNAKEKI